MFIGLRVLGVERGTCRIFRLGLVPVLRQVTIEEQARITLLWWSGGLVSHWTVAAGTFRRGSSTGKRVSMQMFGI